MILGWVLVLSLLFASPVHGAEHRHIGLTHNGGGIQGMIVVGASSASPTVLLVGGLTGNDESVRFVEQEVRSFEAIRQDHRRFQLIAIPLANPDGNQLHFPPSGLAYKENVESHALWRWIGIHAPDLVLVIGNENCGLTEALSSTAVAGVGKIPARRVDNISSKERILQSLPKEIATSEAHREIERRIGRNGRQLTAELAQVYGHDFNQVTYIPTGLALIGQLRLGRTAEVERLAAPYVEDTKNPLERPNSRTLAIDLVFAELGERTADPRYIELVRNAASLAFTEDGEVKEPMPFDDEMGDSAFMAIPLLTRAGKLTGNGKYFDMAVRHLTFMQKLVLRPDGLYRHSPSTDAAWGRGNAFPALGLMLALSDVPLDSPQFSPLLRAFRNHMAALSRFQDEDGLWRQVIDHPGAYSEFFATAIIATAMLRGVNNGWLEWDDFQPLVEKAWHAILARTAPDGRLLDVCESTNKQPSLEDDLGCPAIAERDPGGGAMALMLALEIAGL